MFDGGALDSLVTSVRRLLPPPRDDMCGCGYRRVVVRPRIFRVLGTPFVVDRLQCGFAQKPGASGHPIHLPLGDVIGALASSLGLQFLVVKGPYVLYSTPAENETPCPDPENRYRAGVSG